MAELWEQAPHETARAFEAKSKYLDMGAARSLAKVGQVLGKSTTLMERWSTQFDWVETARAWDAHLSAIDLDVTLKRRAQIADQVERMRWELPGLAMDDAAKLASAADKLLSVPYIRRKGKDEASAITATQEYRAAGELLAKADDLRRKALGLPSHILAGKLDLLDNDQLQMLIMLAANDQGETDTGTTERDGGAMGQPQPGQV